MAQYGIYFQREGEEPYLLPVNPETLPVERTADNGEYNVLGIGPIMIPRIPNQKVITIESFFPGRPFSGMLQGTRGFVPPAEYINLFENAMKNREVLSYQPIRYYENGEPFFGGDDDGGFAVLVTSFLTEERGGETGDFYYALELTEYRDYAPQELTFQQPSVAEEPAVVTPEPTRPIPTGEIVVGSTCVLNGRYYSSSYGDPPSGKGAGRRAKISRIVDKSRKCPYHLTTESGGALGWIGADGLQVVSE